MSNEKILLEPVLPGLRAATCEPRDHFSRVCGINSTTRAFVHSLQGKAPRTEDSFLQVILQAQALHPKKNKVFEHLHVDGGLLTKSAVTQELQHKWNEAAKKSTSFSSKALWYSTILTPFLM